MQVLMAVETRAILAIDAFWRFSGTPLASFLCSSINNFLNPLGYQRVDRERIREARLRTGPVPVGKPAY